MDCWKLDESSASSSASSSSTIGSLTAPLGGEGRISLADEDNDDEEEEDDDDETGRETVAGDCGTCDPVDARALRAELGAAT